MENKINFNNNYFRTQFFLLIYNIVRSVINENLSQNVHAHYYVGPIKLCVTDYGFHPIKFR